MLVDQIISQSTLRPLLATQVLEVFNGYDALLSFMKSTSFLNAVHFSLYNCL